jgi:hypothetical protein
MARKVKGIRSNEHWMDQDVPRKFRPGFLARLDGRTEIARALRDRFDTIAADLGGPSELSAIKASLLERFLFGELWLTRLELQIATAPDATTAADISARWIYGLNAFVGLARTLGLDRKAKTLDLETYLKSNSQLTEAAPAGDQGPSQPEPLPADGRGLAGPNSAMEGGSS